MNAGSETGRRTPLRLLSHHLVTAGGCFAFLFGAPVILCLAFIIQSGDAGGPLFLPIFIMGCMVFAAVVTLVLAGVALVADVYQRRRGRSSWWPAVGVFLLGAIMSFMVGGLVRAWIPVVAGAAAVLGYGMYLLAVSLVSRLFAKIAS